MSKYLPLFDRLTLDKPLATMTNAEKNEEAKHIWEHESLGGIAENNNPLPRPVVGLLLLTFLTAMAWTFPLYGQRPSAAMYLDYVTLMNSAPIQKVLSDKGLSSAERDQKAMKMIVDELEKKDSKYSFQRIQHPISMDDLRIMAPKIIELNNQHVDLEEYSIIGSDVSLANFEGNYRADGTRIHKQPWWDKGYTTAVIYFLNFCLWVMVAVKRLPPITWQPDHTIAH